MVQVDETTQGVLNQISEGFEQKGAYNLRQNGIPLCHGDSEHIKIRKKEDKPGIDILIDGETKGEKVFIPVVVSVSGMTDLVYNDIYRIMQLGADGVQMGTRFVTTEECDADPAFKQTYLDAKPQDIEIIKSPVGMPGRAIHSSFLDRVKEGLKRPKNCPFDCIKTCDVTHSPYCIMLALYNAFKGKLQNGYAFCGANAWRAEKIQSVRDLMAALRDEYDNFSLKEKLFGAR